MLQYFFVAFSWRLYIMLFFVFFPGVFIFCCNTFFVAFPWRLAFLGRVGLSYVRKHPKGQPPAVLVLKGHSLKSNPTACWISNQGSN